MQLTDEGLQGREKGQPRRSEKAIGITVPVGEKGKDTMLGENRLCRNSLGEKKKGKRTADTQLADVKSPG